MFDIFCDSHYDDVVGFKYSLDSYRSTTFDDGSNNNNRNGGRFVEDDTARNKVEEDDKLYCRVLPENCLYPPKILCRHHFTKLPAIVVVVSRCCCSYSRSIYLFTSHQSTMHI